MKKILFILALLAYLSLVYAGSANECMDCHQFSFSSSSPSINTSVFGVHIDINLTDGEENLTSWDCMACHYSASPSGHSVPVSTYTCEDCHINRVIPAAPGVYNHDGSGNISVAASCGDCHNKTANLFRYSSDASAAHYGMDASFGLSPGEPYCAFCHQNSSSIYRDIMQDQDNNRVGNHTSGIINPGHPAGRPDCTGCHGIDKIHGANLIKPSPDSGFCNNCHRNDRLQKDRHAGSVECIRCHADTAFDVHNIKYLLQDGTYLGVNATSCGDCHDFALPAPSFRLRFSAANCTTCHLGSGLIKFAEAPRFPSPMRHSSNPVSGGLWNGSQPAYWNSQISACYYCHGNTLHDTQPIGNVSNIRSGNAINQSITGTGFWCANCHYQDGSSGNFFYNATSYYPSPPEIQNKSGLVPARASDGTAFYYHSLGEYSDVICMQCHAANSPATTALFIHNISTGGVGPDCMSCHDIRGGGAPADKRIDIIGFNKSMHYGINGGGNRACWACHGNGTRPVGHPPRYKSPGRCSSDECHSLDQQFRSPMIYSHFKNASLNNNPTNAVNYNVTVGNDCQQCHVNSVYSEGRNINSTASHFVSNDLPDSINCIYCHLNEDNSRMWGNATLIYKNRTALVELDRENNKFTAREGASVDFGSGFSLNVLEVSAERGSALIEIIKGNKSVDKSLIRIGNYTYEEYLTIDNGSKKVPVIVINVTGIFKTSGVSFMEFKGFRLKRVHPERKTISCYSCHVYASPKIKYRVIERVSSEKDEIYYTKETVNFTDQKVFNETAVLQLLGRITDEDQHINIQPEKRRALYEGERWDISEETSLMVKGVDTKSEVVFLQLRTGNYFYEDLVNRGDIFEFTPSINYLGNQPKNVTLFRAVVSEIIQAKPKNMVVLEDAVGLSPEIKKILTNQTLVGFNTSWLWENSTIYAGKIPENFHSPQVFDGRDGGGNCLSCHGREGFSEKKVLSPGRHDMLNGGGNNACYACHGGTKDIKTHPPGYKNPRNCVSCHASTYNNYSAVYIGDEEHMYERCEACHVLEIHNIIGLNMIPAVREISLKKEDNRTILRSFVLAGYKMKIRDARYYIDSPLEKLRMYPVDGIFDSQVEEVFAEVDVSKISSGKHMMFVEAMERNDEWGIPSSHEFTIEAGNLRDEEEKKAGMSMLADTLITLLIIFVMRRFVAGSVVNR